MAKQTLSLDIREHGIDWVLLRTGFRTVKIENSGQLECRITNGDSSNAVAALGDLRQTINAPGLACLAAIDGRGLFARNIILPFQNQRKVRQILPLELEATLPVAIDALAMDFQTAEEGGVSAVLSAAVSRTQIDFYLQLLRDAGLDPVLITFSGLPTAMLMAAGPLGDQTSLLIDGDRGHCVFFVVGRHRLQFLRSWTPSATDDAPDHGLKRAIDQTLGAVSQIIPDHSRIGQIYLTARAAHHFGPDQLTALLDLDVAVFDPARSTGPNLIGELAGGKGQNALALGLYEPMAEKGLNFFRPTFPLKRFLEQHRKPLIRSGILAAVLAIIFFAGIFREIRQNEARAQVLRTEAESILKKTFPQTRNIIDPLPQMMVALREARNEGMSSSSGAQFTKIDTLFTISRSLPPQLDIHVSELVAGTERVQMSGTTGTFEAVNEAKGYLEKSGYFDKITIISANMDQKTKRVRFRLSADMRRQPLE